MTRKTCRLMQINKQFNKYISQVRDKEPNT